MQWMSLPAGTAASTAFRKRRNSWWRCRCMQRPITVPSMQEGAQRVDGRGAAEAGAEGGVEPLAMHADEQADAAVGGRAGQDGQHREQQQVGEAVTLALAAARVGDPVQGGEQAGERHHGSFRGEGSTLNSSGALPVPRPPAPPSQTAHGQNRTALEMPRWGRSQERSSDQKPSAVLTCTSQKLSPSSSRAYSPRAWHTVLCP